MLEALATPVGVVLRTIHALYSGTLGLTPGLAWGLSIVSLTILVRLVLFPLFVKQIKSQRRMQQIAPMVKELQKKHKGDRETLNKELMGLYKENNANPISGCLPLLLQLPVFFALFHVINNFGPGKEAKYGLSSELIEEGAAAQVFGAPISANFRTSAEALGVLGAEVTTVRVVAAVMVILMGATTYWTQRQMIARSGTTDPQQLMVQKFLLYVLPLSFAVSGVIFPIGVLLYWVTTNIWSMGQQAYVIKRMPPPVAPGSSGGSGGGSGGGKGGPSGGGKGGVGTGPGNGTGTSGKRAKAGAGGKGSAAVTTAGGAEAPPATTPAGTPTNAGAATSAGTVTAPPAARPGTTSSRRAAGSRKNKRKGGRR